MSKEKKSKKSGEKIIVLLVIIIIAAVVILLLGKGGFGNGGSGSGDDVPAGGTIPPMSEETVTTAPESETETSDSEENGQTGHVLVEIAEDRIFADGSVCSDAGALKDYLLGAAGEGVDFILRDNHAVKSVYDEAKAVFDELGYEYSTETVE